MSPHPPSPRPSFVEWFKRNRVGPRYFRIGLLGSLWTHLLVALIVVFIIDFLYGLKSINELMAASSIQSSGPAPQQIEVELKKEDPPPPPTDSPEFVIQIEIPKVKPPEPPKPKPTPTPEPPKPRPPEKPAYTAPKSYGNGDSDSVTKVVIGTSHLPHPNYPTMARNLGQQGIVLLRIHFDSQGKVDEADIIQSSGSHILDTHSREYILDFWQESSYAGRTTEVPIDYILH